MTTVEDLPCKSSVLSDELRVRLQMPEVLKAHLQWLDVCSRRPLYDFCETHSHFYPSNASCGRARHQIIFHLAILDTKCYHQLLYMITGVSSLLDSYNGSIMHHL